MRFTLLCIVLFTSCFASAQSLEEWKQRAEQGDAIAQYQLAARYANGQGVVKNDAEVIKWLQLSAEQGFAQAQYFLGAMYLNGKRLKKNYSKAEKWYRLAAEQGRIDAQLALGDLYYWGEGVEQDNASAAKWYRLAAEQGDLDATYKTGTAYDDSGAIDDAIYWYAQAAEKGDARATFLLGLNYEEKGNHVAKMSIFEMLDSNPNATPEMFNSIGKRYENYLSRDINRAKYWYQKAASLGSKEAVESLEAMDTWGYKIVDGVYEIGKAGFNFYKENEEEIKDGAKVVAGVIAAAVIYDKLSSDEICFRPNNDECNGWQSTQHETLYDKVRSHMRGYAPTVGACESSQKMAGVINGLVEQASWHTVGSVLRVIVDGDAEDIFVDVGEFRSKLSENNGC